MVLRFRVNSESRKRWIPSSLDVLAGTVERNGDSGSYLSVGPSYRFALGNNSAGRWFAEIGVHPTWLARTVFDGRQLGGNFHVTSNLSLGRYLGHQRKTSVLLRYQHTSNAGLDRHNPGFNMLGITMSYHFGANKKLFAAEASDKK